MTAPVSTREAVTGAVPFLHLAADALDAAARDDRRQAQQHTTRARDAYMGLRDQGDLPDAFARALNVILGYTADAACEVPS